MYSLVIWLFAGIVRLVACFGNKKAKQLAAGQKTVWKEIAEKLPPDGQKIWIHCASVGEFEQGRPLIEDIKANYPQYKIIVTFFSPSGYTLRKDYPQADGVFYLPYDTRRNAKRFVQQVNPEKIYFIKYEFWRNYLRVIKKRSIPFYLVSANFRPNQAFFKWYGGWYRKLLTAFTHLFVQNQTSKDLLGKIGFNNVTVTGDTRFDRVCRIVDHARLLPEIERFVQGQPCVVAGSTWPADEKLLVEYINSEKRLIKWIIAPHEMHESQFKALEESVKLKSVRYSQIDQVMPDDYQLLIIDNIGMLSSLYRYGAIAYIGGGFGKGIHNTLEAAAYGIPVLFGPAYKKFQEAVDLVAIGAAFPIKNDQELYQQMNLLLTDPVLRSKAGDAAGEFVASGRGATQKVLQLSFGE